MKNGSEFSQKCENSTPKFFVFKFNSRSHGEKCQMHLFIFTLKNGMKNPQKPCGVWGFVTCIYFGHIIWLGHRDSEPFHKSASGFGVGDQIDQYSHQKERATLTCCSFFLWLATEIDDTLFCLKIRTL